MEKLNTTLSAQDRVILFCVAAGIAHGSVGITDHAMHFQPLARVAQKNPDAAAVTLEAEEDWS